MQTIKIAEKDFSEWAELAENDAEAFESERQAAIEAYIQSVPEAQRERLVRLQWRIDQERRLARTPMAACLKLSRMMWSRVLGPGGLREQFDELSGTLRGVAPADRLAASRTREVADDTRVVAFAPD